MFTTLLRRTRRLATSSLVLGILLASAGHVAAQDTSDLFTLDKNGLPEMAPMPTTKTWKIGVSQIGASFPFVIAMLDGSNKAAADMKFDQIVTDAQGDITKQVAQLEDIISQKPDGIVLVALDAEAVIPELDAATKAGIPVLTCWNDLGGAPRENYGTSISLIGVDEVQTGRDVASLALKELPEGGEVAIVEGAAGFQASIERSEGFKEVLASHPEFKIVASQPGNWTRDGALAAAENIIQAHPNLKLIYAHDDGMAMGVYSAVSDAGLADQIKVVGVGGSIEGLQAIKDGQLYGTVFDSPKAAAYICSKALIAHLEGKTVPANIFLPRPIVTKANVDSFTGEW